MLIHTFFSNGSSGISHIFSFYDDYHGNYAHPFYTLHVFSCKVKKTTTHFTKRTTKDPLERIHSKLSTSGNADINEPPVDKTVAAPSIVPTSSDASGRPSPPVADVQATTTGIRTSGSDESVSARTAKILPTLLAMKDATVSHATRPASVDVNAPEINLSKEDSRSSDTDSKRVAADTYASTKEGVVTTIQNEMPSTGETHGTMPQLLVVQRLLRRPLRELVFHLGGVAPGSILHTHPMHQM